MAYWYHGMAILTLFVHNSDLPGGHSRALCRGIVFISGLIGGSCVGLFALRPRGRWSLTCNFSVFAATRAGVVAVKGFLHAHVQSQHRYLSP